MGTVPSSPMITGITITFMIHNFFLDLWQGTCLSFLFLWFCLCGPSGQQIPFFIMLAFFLSIITRCGLLARIRWSVCISKSRRNLCVSFSRMYSGLYIYHLILWSNFHFLHNSQCIIFPTQSCLILHYFCASLQHLLMWFIISSLSPNNLHLLVCFVLSIFSLT